MYRYLEFSLAKSGVEELDVRVRTLFFTRLMVVAPFLINVDVRVCIQFLSQEAARYFCLYSR